MFVNLTEVLLNEDRVDTIQAEPEFTQITIGGEVFPVSGITPFALTFTNLEKGKSGEKAESCSAPAAADVLRTWRRHWSL